MSIQPAARPQLSEARVRDILKHHGLPLPGEPVSLLAVRGYFEDSMGKADVNDVGIYDDAMFVIGPGLFKAANANTDPSRLGWNTGVGKPFAVLQPGIWYFRRGPHKGRMPALRQCTDEEAAHLHIPGEGEFLVERSWGVGDSRNYKERGYYAINIHAGGVNGTSSWGCQTIPPSQFEDFMLSVHEACIKVGQKRIPYLLIDGPIA